MTIGVVQVDFHLPGAFSLKDRRRVVKGICRRLHNRYNCSVAEVGDKERWTWASIAVCIVGDNARFVNSQLDTVIQYCSSLRDAEMVNCNLELI